MAVFLSLSRSLSLSLSLSLFPVSCFLFPVSCFLFPASRFPPHARGFHPPVHTGLSRNSGQQRIKTRQTAVCRPQRMYRSRRERSCLFPVKPRTHPAPLTAPTGGVPGDSLFSAKKDRLPPHFPFSRLFRPVPFVRFKRPACPVLSAFSGGKRKHATVSGHKRADCRNT